MVTNHINNPFKMNGAQYLEMLKSIDERLWEQVLDTVATYHDARVGQQFGDGHYHYYDSDGNITVLLD
jgi:hypothetical protein